MFGADDPYLNAHVAHRFARLFPNAQLQLIPGARHYVQVDEPKVVAEAIVTADRPLSHRVPAGGRTGLPVPPGQLDPEEGPGT